MVLVSIFFTRIRSTEGSSADCSLFILSLHALALHLVKLLLQIFLYEDLSTLALHTSVGCISLQNANGPHFVTQPILLSENIPNIDINHQQNTRRSDQIETIKTIMQLRALVSHGRFYQWLRLPFLKIMNQWKFWLNWLFWTKTSQRLHYIYYLATDNIHIVLEKR